MRHALRRALPVMAVGALVSFGAPTPAQAHTDACTGQFVLTSGGGLGAPVVTNVTTGFSMSMVTGVCASGGTFSASGTFNGACALASGSGFANSGHSFSFQLTGTMTLTGQVTGNLNVAPDATAGQSCISGANRFILTGTVVLAP